MYTPAVVLASILTSVVGVNSPSSLSVALTPFNSLYSPTLSSDISSTFGSTVITGKSPGITFPVISKLPPSNLIVIGYSPTIATYSGIPY